MDYPEHYANIFQRLEEYGLERSGDGWKSLCPVLEHKDAKTKSLSINVSDKGHLMFKCFRGCEFKKIIGALGVEAHECFAPDQNRRPGMDQPKSSFKCAYDYRDEQGNLLFQVIRWEPKDFRPRRPAREDDDPSKVRESKDGHRWVYNLEKVRRVLYRLPELAAADPTRMVLFPEGEKDVDRLIELGFVATTNLGGANKWDDAYSESLRDRSVAVLLDNDDAGREHGELIRGKLAGIAKSVHLVQLPGLPEKGDVSDWLDAGHGKDDLVNEVSRQIQAGELPPPPKPVTQEGGGVKEDIDSLKRFIVESLDKIKEMV